MKFQWVYDRKLRDNIFLDDRIFEGAIIYRPVQG
jgi:hypothetical protein